ncbi:MAG: hypothetical protein ACP5O1_12655 [Phycisphaerae bacterium]
MNAEAAPAGRREPRSGRPRWVSCSGLLESLCVVTMWGSILWAPIFFLISANINNLPFNTSSMFRWCVADFLGRVSVLFFATTVVAAVPVLAWRKLPARRRLIAMLGIALLAQIIGVLLTLLQPPLIK